MQSGILHLKYKKCLADGAPEEVGAGEIGGAALENCETVVLL